MRTCTPRRCQDDCLRGCLSYLSVTPAPEAHRISQKRNGVLASETLLQQAGSNLLKTTTFALGTQAPRITTFASSFRRAPVIRAVTGQAATSAKPHEPESQSAIRALSTNDADCRQRPRRHQHPHLAWGQLLEKMDSFGYNMYQ